MSKQLANIENWPIVWRVTAPAAGSYDHDMVFTETDDREAALKKYRALRRTGYPVRLEQVRCGPLPADSADTLRKLRAGNAQNAGTVMREVPGAWIESPGGAA